MTSVYGPSCDRTRALLSRQLDTQLSELERRAIGIHTATADSTAMFVLLGQVDRGLRGREAFQEVDLVHTVGGLAKWAGELQDAESAAETLEAAVRATVEGRSDEMLHFGTAAIHPLVIRSVLVKTPAVSDYQVRQAGRGIDVRVLAAAPVDLERLRRELRSALSAAGLPHPEVAVHAVQALERHPETGKLRRFVSA